MTSTNGFGIHSYLSGVAVNYHDAGRVRHLWPERNKNYRSGRYLFDLILPSFSHY